VLVRVLERHRLRAVGIPRQALHSCEGGGVGGLLDSAARPEPRPGVEDEGGEPEQGDHRDRHDHDYLSTLILCVSHSIRSVTWEVRFPDLTTSPKRLIEYG